MVDNKNSIILDFFAGSGTTGQAVMELNKEDGGNRKFILVTNDVEILENKKPSGKTIARDICYERLYRVINGKGTKNEKINWTYSKEVPFLKDNSLMVFNINYANIGIKDDLTNVIKEIKSSMKSIDKNFNQDEESITRKLYSLHPKKEVK